VLLTVLTRKKKSVTVTVGRFQENVRFSLYLKVKSIQENGIKKKIHLSKHAGEWALYDIITKYGLCTSRLVAQLQTTNQT
jgi:hypothetical protein